MLPNQLANGERFRLLTSVDNFSRESLEIRVSQCLAGDHVLSFLEEVTQQRDTPKTIQRNEGPNRTSHAPGETFVQRVHDVEDVPGAIVNCRGLTQSQATTIDSISKWMQVTCNRVILSQGSILVAPW